MTLRADAMILTHGRDDRLVAAALLLDGILGGQLDVEHGYLVGGSERAEDPLPAELRARVLAGPPEPVSAWIDRATEFAPTRVAADLVAAGRATPRTFQRVLMLSIDARAETAARARIADDPALAALLHAAGYTALVGPFPPVTCWLPRAAVEVIAALRAPGWERARLAS